MLSYGSSETGIICTRFASKRDEIAGSTIPVGYVTQDKKVLLLDENHNKVGSGEIGEIGVQSRYLACGYWGNAELSRRKFIPDPDGGEGRICLTGDLGRFLPDGCLVHLGRKDNLVKVRGHRVGISEIENALLEHAGVQQAAVATWDRDGAERYLAAYIVARTNPAPSVDELSNFLRNRLPDYMIPSAFLFLQKLPQTNGKIDRRSLPRPERSRPSLSQSYAPAGNDIERILVEIWEDVLDLRPVGIHDNFFDLGGHSLAATRVVSQVIKRLQLELPLQSLFQSPTVADMAAVIGEHRKTRLTEEELERILTELEAMPEQEAQKRAAADDK